MEGVKGYIFDYGGTLDTCGCHWGMMLWHAYCRCNVGVSEQQFRDAYVYAERTLGRNPIIKPSFTFRKTLDTKIDLEMQWLANEGGWNVSKDERRQAHDAVLNDLYYRVKQTTKYSSSILAELHRRYPMVLVSNFYGNINEVLKEMGFDGLFSHVIESAVVGIRKPDPHIFTLGVEALKLDASETVVVGDSLYKDIIPAYRAGCNTVWYKGEGWQPETKEDKEAATAISGLQVISDLAQLLDK